MIDKELLETNGWVIECESPFEIRHEDGSFATLNAAYIVVEELRSAIMLERIVLIKNAFKANLIFTDDFIKHIINTLEQD